MPRCCWRMCLGMSRAQPGAVANDLPSARLPCARFESLLQRRLAREPVAYITGRQEFWSLDFAVTPDVSDSAAGDRACWSKSRSRSRQFGRRRNRSQIARPGHWQRRRRGEFGARIAVRRKLYATDISPAALAIARRNAARNEVAARCNFSAGDLFAALAGGRF